MVLGLHYHFSFHENTENGSSQDFSLCVACPMLTLGGAAVTRFAFLFLC